MKQSYKISSVVLLVLMVLFTPVNAKKKDSNPTKDSSQVAQSGYVPDTIAFSDSELKAIERDILSKDTMKTEGLDFFYCPDSTCMFFLDEFAVVANIRDIKPLYAQPGAFSKIDLSQLEMMGVRNTNDMSSNTPNFHMPEFGSSRFSSIYVRGFGTMYGDPVMSLNIDNVPILSSAAYSMELYDVERVEMLRGPQGVSTGRNSLMGQMNVYTRTPLKYTGTDASVDYSTANTVRVNVGTYQKPRERFGFSISAKGKHTDGFFTNAYTGKKIDKQNSLSLRVRTAAKPREKNTIDNVATASYLVEGTNPYAFIDQQNQVQDISINDENKYSRFTFTDGLVMQYIYDKFAFSSITGYQYLNDDLKYDADFSAKDLISRKLKQTEHALSHEFNFRSKENNEKKYQWKAGLFFFFKHNKMSMPISYRKDGIDDVFSDDLNKAIQSRFPTSYLTVEGDRLNVDNDLESPTFGTAVYHQSEINTGKWDFTIGFRLNLEHTSLSYYNINDIYYNITAQPDYPQELYTYLYGDQKMTDFTFLPKVTAQYNIDNYKNVYINISRGHRSGGYNAHLFSDIMQYRMKNQILKALEIDPETHGIPTIDYNQEISYKPEKTMNFEVGTHILAPEQHLNFDMCLFYIIGRNQQIHTFPLGENTGSMIINADKSQSVGGELTVNYQSANPEEENTFSLTGSIGIADAKLKKYTQNGTDYKNMHIPFAPLSTLSLDMGYMFKFDSRAIDKLTLSMGMEGSGRIYWDLANKYTQPFYMILNASVAYECRRVKVKAYIENLADKEYVTYMFESLGDHFCQQGKPRQIGISFSYHFQ